jgi:hypothetical protein
MISDLFKTKGHITGTQLNFLKVISQLPKIKNFMGDMTTNEDILVSDEAKSIISSKKNKRYIQ